MPAEISGTASGSRSAIPRAAASAEPAGLLSAIGAPKIASTASPSNLLTRPSCSMISSTITAKKSLSSPTTSVGLRLAANVVDPMTSMNREATVRSAPPSSGSPARAASATSWPTCPAEQVAHPFAFAQARHHVVEPRLQVADLGAVVHHHVGVEVAPADPVERLLHRADGTDDAHAAQDRQDGTGGQADHRQDDDADEQLDLGGLVAETPNSPTSRIPTSGIADPVIQASTHLARRPDRLRRPYP